MPKTTEHFREKDLNQDLESQNKLGWAMNLKMFLIASTILMACAPNANADDYDANSPISWTARVTTGNKSKTYSKDEFASLIKSKIIDKSINLTCTFEFSKALVSKTHTQKLKNASSDEYTEMTQLLCKIGKVDVFTDAVSCSRSESDPSDTGSGGIYFTGTSIRLYCLTLTKE